MPAGGILGVCWLVLTVNLTKSGLSWEPEPWGLPCAGGGGKWCDLDCVTEVGKMRPSVGGGIP